MSVRSSLYYRRGAGGKVAIEDMAQSTGQRFFVSSGTGTDGTAYGFTPDRPFATLDYAVGKCTASKGDIIYLMPGHAESLATATSAAVDIAGISIIGIGSGSLTPTFTLATATTATIAVTAADVTIRNIKVISDLADVAAGITASAAADGLTVEDCWFTDGGLTKELVIGILLATGCDNVLIRNNRFYTTISAETGGCASAISFAGTTANSRIIGNFAHGHYTVACLDNATAAALEILIEGNRLINIDTGAGLAASLFANTTGLMINNVVIGAKNNTVPISDVSNTCCAQNWGADVLGAVKAIDTPTTAASYT
jgi:hypothetical protein